MGVQIPVDASGEQGLQSNSQISGVALDENSQPLADYTVELKTVFTLSGARARQMVATTTTDKILASLNHPNIGHIYGLEEAEG